VPEASERCRLYLITPSEFELETFAEQLRQAFAGGDVASVQLRMKEASDEEIMAAAEILMPICHENEAVFIINDHPEIAKKIGADGVHIGDEDITVAEAREIVGEASIIGASCYGSRDRAMEAGEQGADYVAFGQFYETKTKPAKGHPEPEILQWWSTATVLPCVAIGGIKADNCMPLVKAGADFLAVVTGIWEYESGPKQAVKEFNEAIDLALS
jgi:thiamine-phosphate pyrophosphorylase